VRRGRRALQEDIARLLVPNAKGGRGGSLKSAGQIVIGAAVDL
jgi:hypothetical protein